MKQVKNHLSLKQRLLVYLVISLLSIGIYLIVLGGKSLVAYIAR